MDSNSEKDREEDMDVLSVTEASQHFCTCGAYARIIPATSLLRRRIIEAVNHELDQYEQPLGVPLCSSSQDASDPTQLMRLVKALDGLSVWIDFTAAKCNQLPLALWNSVHILLNQLEKQLEQSASEVTATAKTVPIASPEETAQDDTVAGNWLECILEQVPAMLDHQTAVQSQIVSEIEEISKRVVFLLRLLSNAKGMTLCSDIISKVVEKIQNLSNNEIVNEFHASYVVLSRNGQIDLELQHNRLFDEERAVLDENSHYMKKQHATDYSRQTLDLLEKILQDENAIPSLVHGVISLLLTLIHRDTGCPWVLDLKMLGRVESDWSKMIHSLAEFSLRHPSQSFLSGTYALLTSEHFQGAGESMNLSVLLFVLRHLPRLISDQGQKDVQNFNNHYPGMEAIIKQFVHPDNVSKLADRAVKLFSECLDETEEDSSDDIRGSVDEYLLHQHLRHEISRLLLHEVQEKWKNKPEKDSINASQLKWVVRVSTSGQYSREIAERAEQELNKLGADNAAQIRFCYISETLLAGATSAQPMQIFEKKYDYAAEPLLGIFCTFYGAVLCSDKVRPSWIEVDAEVMHCAMRDSVGAVLRPSLIEDLHDFFPITVQSTDRLAQTALTWTGRQAAERRDRLLSLVPLGRLQDVFHEVLMVICSNADAETHIEVLRHCSENLPSWIEVSTDEENVMRGQALLTNGNRLVFRLMVVSNLLEYCSQLGKHAEPYNSDAYFSDSETLKVIITVYSSPPCKRF
ncbi:unnamed protein product [Nippostrongylus brasiliensis]|uniref:Non-specific serine/threonine protein kinase n=1 Tax=Nippostrongylus brasiliensis TaxID=27835 RepID=A0A158R3A8_NIPBR|nr:unnamed protein product [Nippostrongylus brasiliensis]